MNEASNGSTRTSPLALSERVRSLRLPDAREPAPAGRGWLPWVLCALCFGASALLALEAFAPINDDLLKKLAEERGLNVGKETPANSSIALPGVSASPTAEGGIALESKGYVTPISLIQVSPIIGGTVLKLNVEEGRRVEKDFVLAELDPTEFKADYDKSVASKESAAARLEELRRYRKEEIEQARADLDDAIAQRDQAQAKYTRGKRLQAINALSPEDFEAAYSSFLSMDARVRRWQLVYDLLVKGPRDEKIAAAVGDLAQAQADYDKAAWRYRNTKVKAPITGIILSKKTEEGNIVNPSAFSNGLSASLCEMADLLELEVDLSIAERDIAKVFKSQDCLIRAEAFSNRFYKGYVSRIMPMGDRSKGAVPVRVKVLFPAQDAKGQPLPLENQGEYLRPEMGAIVTFLNRKASGINK